MKTTFRLFAAALATALLVQPVLAQQPQKKDEKPATPNEIAVVPLKHSVAFDLIQVISKLYGPTTVLTADPNTNSVIVSAQPDVISEIKEVIAKIDAPAARKEAPGKQLRVFTLRNIQTNNSLQDAVKLAIEAGGSAGKAAFDPARNQVIVSADEPTLKVVEALLARLDVAVADRPAVDLQVRVVWLSTGAAANELAPPPDDMKEVLPALAKLGIDKPRLAAQTLVNVAGNFGFKAEGMVSLNEPVRFSVSGQVNDRGDQPLLSMSLRAVGPNNNLYSSLATEISAPIGHLVVLGVTPTHSLASVFVVQLLKK